MRFGFTPLFIDAADVDAAVAVIARVMNEALWDNPQFQARSAVT
jgi:kynureninase